MCDYSLQAKASRPAVVGERLVSHDFGTGTRGFRADADQEGDVAVCVLPGTELAFGEPPTIHSAQLPLGGYVIGKAPSAVARFRQTNREHRHMHHDQLEFPDGSTVLLTHLASGQRCTVLQLPAAPRNEAEVEEQRRVEYAG